MPAPAADTPALAHKDIVTILSGLMVAMFPAALDATIMGPAMPTLARELGDAQHLPWVITAYLLVATASTPLYGKLSDIHGRRPMLLIGLGVFALGSALCALAPSIFTLALARAVQAMGGGGILSVAMTIVGDMVPPKQRIRYQVFTSTMWTTASVAGPLIGGYFAEHWHWSWIFWINLPLCFVGWVMTGEKLKRLPRRERPHALDFPGAILLVTASVLFQLALTWGGGAYAWSSAPILGLFVATILATALLAWRLRTAKEPLISYALLSNNIVLTTTTSVGLAMGVYIALSIYLPIYFEAVRGLSATMSGVALLPLMIFPTAGAMIAGRAMLRLARYRFVPIVGMVVSSLSLAPMILAPADAPLVAIEIILTVIATGVGMMFPVSTVSTQNAVAPHELGTAMALVTFARNLGSALGVAVFGAIVLGGSVRGRAGDAVASVTAQAFSWALMASAAGFLIAAAILAFMREKPLRDQVTLGQA